ncbi:MAG: DUF427 domain-containing protein [Acidimicrobiales bacterium]
MSLTIGTIAPLGRPTGGQLNFDLPAAPVHLLYLHDVAPRLRAEHEGVTIVDTIGARMLHETGLLPRWYLPRADVREECLEPSETVTHCPFKGDARYWHLRVGEVLVEDAFWEYPTTVQGCPPLTGMLSPYLEKFDRWLEEDEPVLGHPRDPFHRVDARRSSRTVTVRVGEVVVARSTAPVALNETGLATRWYLPLDDVDQATLRPSATSSVCPYKGTARYWALEAGGVRIDDAVWGYDDPLPEAVPARGCVSFADAVAVEVE